MKNSKTGIFSLTLLVSIASPIFGAEATPPREGYQYPELLVVPKASQRLSSEAANESKTSYRTHLLLQVPAFMNVVAGVSAMSMKDAKSKEAGAITAGIGVGWLLTTIGLSAFYTPYNNGLNDIKALTPKTTEQTLARERRAEEALQLPAYLMRRIQWISAFSNAGAALAVTSLVEENDKVKAIAGVSLVTAFLPLVFDHPWIANYDQQMDYKKRIYGPVAQLTLLESRMTLAAEPARSSPSETARTFAPGLLMSLRF